MKPFVVEYLRTHTFRELEEEHGVCVRPNKNFDKFSLNYDQIMAKSNNALTNQCRGMVIRPSSEQTKIFIDDEKNSGNKLSSVAAWRDRIVGDVELLAWPMDRFFNYGDPAATEIDWSDENLRVYEKLDGTMCIVYWDHLYDKWFVATRSVPEADLPIHDDHIEIGNITFSELFMKALIITYEVNSGFTIKSDQIHTVLNFKKEYTYVFELTSQYNRIVVRYDVPRVTLLAVRDLRTGTEISIEKIDMHQVNKPIHWLLRDAKAIATFVDNSDPSKLEGAVVVDSKFGRNKIKSQSWILSSKIKSTVMCSKRSAIECILNGSIDDVLPLVDPTVSTVLLDMKDKLRTYFVSVDHNFLKWKHEADGSRKNYAQKVMSSSDWVMPYWALWEDKAATCAEWAEWMAINNKLSTSNLDQLLSKIS